jgi:ubiquitin-like 1-activating enzyme E1 A
MLGTDFFEQFDVVVIGYGSRATKVFIPPFTYLPLAFIFSCSIHLFMTLSVYFLQKYVNEKCRKLKKRVAFYTVDCRDSCGEIFVDLQDYKYTKKKLEEMVECELNFPSFQEAISVPWKPIPRRTAKLYFAMRVIEVFEESEGRKHGECSLLDLARVLEIKKQLCEANSVSESHIPDILLERLITGTTEFPPVCAIVGGILAQEVIKAVSGKGDPLKNFFYYDGEDGKGVMEDISDSFTS